MKYSKAGRTLFVLLLFTTVLLTVLPADEQVQEEESQTEETQRSFLTFGPEEKPKQFLPLPIFIQNPTLGTGFGMALTVLFKTDYEDEESPYSAVSVPGFFTNTQSFFTGAIASLHFLEDTLRVTVGGGYGQVNNSYTYEEFSLTQEVAFSMGIAEALYSFWPNIFLGGSYLLSNVNYLKFDLNTTPIPISNNFSSGIYLTSLWDNRNSIYNPTSGFYAIIHPGFFPEWLGSDRSYITLDYNFNGYQRLADPLVLAYRTAGNHAFGDAAFSSLPTLGMGPDLRGYEAGKYRGSNLISAQAELRWNFIWRMYLSAFGGIGTFYGSDSDKIIGTNWDLEPFPSVGFGLSILTSEETDMMVRFDFAWGKEGDFAWYFQLGNSF